MSVSPPAGTPRAALQVAWVLWGALLAGPLMLAAVVFALPRPLQETTIDLPSLEWAALGMVVAAVPAGQWGRRRVWAKGSRDGIVRPQPWLAGHLLGWACCEAAALFGLVVVLLTGPTAPRLVVPGIAVLAQVGAWPRAGRLGPL